MRNNKFHDIKVDEILDFQRVKSSRGRLKFIVEIMRSYLSCFAVLLLIQGFLIVSILIRLRILLSKIELKLTFFKLILKIYKLLCFLYFSLLSSIFELKTILKFIIIDIKEVFK